MSETWSSKREDPIGDLIRTGHPEQIARTLYPLVRRIAVHVLGDRDLDLIESASGDAVLAVCRHRTAFRGQALAMTWIYAIARRAARRCAGREASRRAHLVEWDESEPQGDLSAAEQIHPLSAEEALESLAEAVPNIEWQRIWLLHNKPGGRCSHKEIAHLTGYTPGSVGVILSRVRRRINAIS